MISVIKIKPTLFKLNSINMTKKLCFWKLKKMDKNEKARRQKAKKGGKSARNKKAKTTAITKN